MDPNFRLSLHYYYYYLCTSALTHILLKCCLVCFISMFPIRLKYFVIQYCIYCNSLNQSPSIQVLMILILKRSTIGGIHPDDRWCLRRNWPPGRSTCPGRTRAHSLGRQVFNSFFLQSPSITTPKTAFPRAPRYCSILITHLIVSALQFFIPPVF